MGSHLPRIFDFKGGTSLRKLTRKGTPVGPFFQFSRTGSNVEQCNRLSHGRMGVKTKRGFFQASLVSFPVH